MTEQVAIVKMWLIASAIPGISLYKNGLEIDVTDKTKYRLKKSSDLLELMLYNPKEQDYGDYAIELWTATTSTVKMVNVTLSKPLGKCNIICSLNLLK